MEINYEHGKLVDEPVLGPDGFHLKMRWLNSYNIETGDDVPGIEIMKCTDPSDFLGTGAGYDLDDLRLLGQGNVQRGIDVVGQEWYRTAWKDIHTIRPLNEAIKSLRQD